MFLNLFVKEKLVIVFMLTCIYASILSNCIVEKVKEDVREGL